MRLSLANAKPGTCHNKQALTRWWLLQCSLPLSYLSPPSRHPHHHGNHMQTQRLWPRLPGPWLLPLVSCSGDGVKLLHDREIADHRDCALVAGMCLASVCVREPVEGLLPLSLLLGGQYLGILPCGPCLTPPSLSSFGKCPATALMAWGRVWGEPAGWVDALKMSTEALVDHKSDIAPEPSGVVRQLP